LKKIAICKDCALKGLAVAVELEKWNPSVEEHKTVREVGICAVATGISSKAETSPLLSEKKKNAEGR